MYAARVQTTYVYGPKGVPLFPTPRLSKTRIEYFGLLPKYSTWFVQAKDVLFSLGAPEDMSRLVVAKNDVLTP
jgi:hypothetical protein